MVFFLKNSFLSLPFPFSLKREALLQLFDEAAGSEEFYVVTVQ